MSEFAPMDILGKKFAKKLHGYAELEVHEYLTDLARVMEGLLRERGELKLRVHHMEQELTAFRDRESALKAAIRADHVARAFARLQIALIGRRPTLGRDDNRGRARRRPAHRR